jgi:hypothetical protein
MQLFGKRLQWNISLLSFPPVNSSGEMNTVFEEVMITRLMVDDFVAAERTLRVMSIAGRK